ncbi:uncharacterized protein METZ01_LOCUS95904 [marine metagenome]|uniref:Uncharacterized protein n=1 Tax=marine metagenome TaxID=408172 RepID=A0A381VRV9_9ZZZZ
MAFEQTMLAVGLRGGGDALWTR